MEYREAFPTVARFAPRANQSTAHLMHQLEREEAKRALKNKADLQIQSILEMADRMIVISEEGFGVCDDDGCLLLNGMVRESAYRLRDAAERERKVHGTRGNREGEKAERIVGGKKAK